MIRSMTGFGRAEERGKEGALDVLVRSVNHRHLKVSIRGPEGLVPYEDRLERLVREHVSRGMVALTVRIHASHGSPVGHVNEANLQAYRDRLQELAERLDLAPPRDLASLLPLPGVICEGAAGDLAEDRYLVIEEVVRQALQALVESRVAEGACLEAGFRAGVTALEAVVQRIQEGSRQTPARLRERLRLRLEALLSGGEAGLDPGTLEREAAVLADRADITEEVDRLRAHIAGFREELGAAAGSGRKLEFYVQEMVREANTMGSKAADHGVAREVIDLKVELERLREQLQNVE
jgi:uncharacterized protein (TIGR00255 family)